MPGRTRGRCGTRVRGKNPSIGASPIPAPCAPLSGERRRRPISIDPRLQFGPRVPWFLLVNLCGVCDWQHGMPQIRPRRCRTPPRCSRSQRRRKRGPKATSRRQCRCPVRQTTIRLPPSTRTEAAKKSIGDPARWPCPPCPQTSVTQSDAGHHGRADDGDDPLFGSRAFKHMMAGAAAVMSLAASRTGGQAMARHANLVRTMTQSTAATAQAPPHRHCTRNGSSAAQSNSTPCPGRSAASAFPSTMRSGSAMYLSSPKPCASR